MIQNPNNSGRRILSFPAIQACECTTPATLLTSLINISRNICGYRSKFFGCNKRNANEAIRQIGILLTLFEEIHDRNSKNLPDSAVLVLSELHLIFQRILYLLQDCALEGARLLILVKSGLVANRFRVLTRSAAFALDAFPLYSIDLPIEVIEQVELVMKQARRVKFDVDREDEEILNEVRLVLNLFDVGVTPDDTQIKRVLDYIGIKKWSSCNLEVKVLDSEMEFEWLSEDKTELSFLSNLMALMNYSCCVLFDAVDRESVRHVECRVEIPDGVNPDDFRCPISLDFMVDPVTVATGHTYDRPSIQKWLRAGNSICPSTGERLKNRDLIPNLALHRMIRQYCAENSIPFAESNKQKRNLTRTAVAGSSTAKKIVRVLAKFLARLLELGTADEKNRAAYEIKLLSKASIFNRSCLVEIGLIPNLLKLLRSSDVLTQKNAIAAVLNLSKHSKGKRVIQENRGLKEIVNVLKSGYTIEARQLAAVALFYMASIEEYRKLIGEIPETVSGLINLLEDDADRSKKNAMVALYGLLLQPKNHPRVISAGIIPLLVNLLKTSDKESLITVSIEILSSLAENPEGTKAILRCGALKSILEFVDSCSSRTGQECSVSLLVALCINGGSDVVGIVSKRQSLMSLLYYLLCEGTNRGSRKASCLIRILHEHCELASSSSDSIDRRLSQDRIVQAW